MRNQLTAAIAATMSLATLDALAAPASMMHTLPSSPQASQSEPAEKSPFSWATKWFREKPIEQSTTAPEGVPTGVIAYQAPTTAASPPKQAFAVATPSNGPQQQVAMNSAWHGFGGMATPSVSTPSQTTSIHQAPRTPIAQVTPNLGSVPTPSDEARELREQGHAKDRAGDLTGAEQLYRQAIAADPTSAASVNDLGLCLARQGKLEPSAAVLRQAVMMRPDKQLYRNNIATVLVELGRTDEALSHLQSVGSSATAHYNVGQLLVRGGKNAEAKTQFDKAIAIEPSLAPAHEALARLVAPTPATTTPATTNQTTRPEPIAVAQAASALPQLPRQTPIDDITPIEPADTEKETLSGPPSFPRLLPPVLNR